MSPRDVQIDSLALHLEGVDPDRARELAQLVAQRLVGELSRAPSEGAIDRLQVEVTARDGEQTSALAARIATAVSVALGPREGSVTQ